MQRTAAVQSVPLLYVADSIADMKAGAEQISADFQANNPHPKLMRPIDVYGLIAERMGRKYIHPTASFIYVPQVWNVPGSEGKFTFFDRLISLHPVVGLMGGISKIKLQDQVGKTGAESIDAYLPFGPIQNLAALIGANTGPHLKESHGRHSVLLYATQHTFGLNYVVADMDGGFERAVEIANSYPRL